MGKTIIHLICILRMGAIVLSTIKDRIVYGRASSKTIRIINEYIDVHQEQLLDIWEKAKRGGKIEKVKR